MNSWEKQKTSSSSFICYFSWIHWTREKSVNFIAMALLVCWIISIVGCHLLLCFFCTALNHSFHNLVRRLIEPKVLLQFMWVCLIYKSTIFRKTKKNENNGTKTKINGEKNVKPGNKDKRFLHRVYFYTVWFSELTGGQIMVCKNTGKKLEPLPWTTKKRLANKNINIENGKNIQSHKWSTITILTKVQR